MNHGGVSLNAPANCRTVGTLRRWARCGLGLGEAGTRTRVALASEGKGIEGSDDGVVVASLKGNVWRSQCTVPKKQWGGGWGSWAGMGGIFRRKSHQYYGSTGLKAMEG